MRNIESLVLSYIDAAIKHGKLTLLGDYKKANKAHDKVINSYKELKMLGEVGLTQIVNMLEHQNMSVRLWAATHSLFVKPELAKKTLTEIMSSTDKHARIDAGIILSEWEKGRLKVDF